MKNLENEYKDLLSKDIPDLWDRIEAGLEEKNVELINNESENDKINDFVGNVNDEASMGKMFSFPENVDGKQSKQKNKFNWKRVIRNCGYIAAACLVVFVGGPLVLDRFNGSRMDSSAPAAAENFYAADNAMDAVCEEAYESPQMNEVDEKENFKTDLQGIKGVDNANSSTVQVVTDYVITVEIVETEPVVKAKVLEGTSDDELIKVDDVITLVGVEDIFDQVIVGDELVLTVEPIWNSDNELEFKVVSK